MTISSDSLSQITDGCSEQYDVIIPLGKYAYTARLANIVPNEALR